MNLYTGSEKEKQQHELDNVGFEVKVGVEYQKSYNSFHTDYYPHKNHSYQQYDDEQHHRQEEQQQFKQYEMENNLELYAKPRAITKRHNHHHNHHNRSTSKEPSTFSVHRTSTNEHLYYSIPELELLSSVVSSFSSPSTSTSSNAAAILNETSTSNLQICSMSSSSSSSVGSNLKNFKMTDFYRTEFDDNNNDDDDEIDYKLLRNSWNTYWKCEQSIIGARASVMVYDDTQKKWVPSGTSSGLSKVQIYHHQQNNTFRVVGRKLHDHEVVINCSILKGLKYNQATATFHQWRDSKFVYGLNFSSQQDAEAFARAMMHALEVLSGRVIQQSIPPPPTNSNGYDEDMGYRTMTREEATILQQQQQISGQVTPNAQTPTSQNIQNIPQSPPTPQGHHRTSSAPPAPQPPPMSMPPQQMYAQTGGGSAAAAMVMQPPPQPPVQPQSQYHPPQSVNQQHHPVYASQSANNAYCNQYQQPIYVSSSSNQSLNQQLQQQQQAPQPPPHQNGPIYVASTAQGIPSSASSNSVVYSSQQQQTQQQPPLLQQQQPPPTQQQQPGYVQVNGTLSTSNDPQYGQIPVAPPMMPSMINVGLVSSAPNVPILPTGSIGRPAPQAPPPPPAFGGPNFTGPPQPPAPPMQPPAPPAMAMSVGGAGAPPPPPPPPIGGLASKKDDGGGMDVSSLAAQLQNARLKRNNKTTPPPAENSGSSTSSGGSGNYGTIGRSSKGMASMMDEMAKTLARRRAQAEKKEPEPGEDNQNARQRPWEKSNTLPHKLGAGSSNNSNSTGTGNANSGSESPRPMRKRFGSASEETILKQVNGEGLSLALSADLDSFKAEIVREMRVELQKAKQDIIDAIKSEFNRR